jgi:hypothetical protein
LKGNLGDWLGKIKAHWEVTEACLEKKDVNPEE